MALHTNSIERLHFRTVFAPPPIAFALFTEFYGGSEYLLALLVLVYGGIGAVNTH